MSVADVLYFETSSPATERIWLVCYPCVAELELEPGRERRTARLIGRVGSPSVARRRWSTRK